MNIELKITLNDQGQAFIYAPTPPPTIGIHLLDTFSLERLLWLQLLGVTHEKHN